MTNKPPVLLLTERKDLAADLLVHRLREKNISFLRFNSEDFPSAVNLSWTPAGELILIPKSGLPVSLQKVRSAWYGVFVRLRAP